MKSYLKTKDFFLSQDEFELLYDEETDMLVTYPQPKDLNYYYESNEYISHSDSTTTFFEKLYKLIKNHNLGKKLRLVENYVDAEKSLLDVGAGTGDFLAFAKKKAWEVEGVEPNKTAQAIANKKGLVLHSDISLIDEKRFDVITLWHVLEHLPDLNGQIKKLTSMLKDGGTLFVAVPNYRSYDARHYGKYWAAFDVPRHLWHFSKNTITILFERNNFKLIKTKPMWFDSFYVSLLSERYKNGRKNWIKAFVIGGWSNIKGIFTKEYSSHIYILKKSN